MRSLVVCLLTVVLSSAAPGGQVSLRMTVHFFEVGQAHSTLLEFPCGTMLVDAGAQDARTQTNLVTYIKEIFQTRPELNNTIDLLLITHNHIDHDKALQAVTDNFTVKRVLHHGMLTGQGAPPIRRLMAAVNNGTLNTFVRVLQDATVRAGGNRDGFTDDFVDPFACPGADPEIRVLSGHIASNPGWSAEKFRNPNNHSLVTRVNFGDASFLFMGDAEEELDERLMAYYAGPARKMLDADVLQVGHHGSINATNPDLVAAVTPEIAVIPVGHWSHGRPRTPFTTYQYGHPRGEVIDFLSAGMSRERSESVEVMVGSGGRQFHKATVSKAIYATDWDGNVKVTATSGGTFTVRRSHID